MMGFKSFDAAPATLTGIEFMRILRNGRLEGEEMEGLTVAEQIYKLAALSPPLVGDDAAQFIDMSIFAA